MKTNFGLPVDRLVTAVARTSLVMVPLEVRLLVVLGLARIVIVRAMMMGPVTRLLRCDRHLHGRCRRPGDRRVF